MVPGAVKKAKSIITVSEYEKNIIADKCHIDPGFIHVIYNGVDKRFHPKYDKEEIESFRQQYKLPEQFYYSWKYGP